MKNSLWPLIFGRKIGNSTCYKNSLGHSHCLKLYCISIQFLVLIMRVTYLGVSESAASIAANSVRIPLYVDSVSAGFPSPAQDFVEKSLDLNEFCVAHPNATFYVRAQGDSMIEAGIHSGDVLVVDRSLTARHGDIVIACIHGEMTVKTLELKPNVLLRPKNKAYKAIHITEESELEIFGVVTGVVRKYERG
ncbi:DNA polymerase V [Marinomonas polaris DSM 16579]|uniref:DNA polymerase V n=2 Tax=Oceanospirillaceae TaxID=135620 RepID=A0A1M5CZ91_9GAMM|nr:DNA polymerase V [Marinomonas polaris DSM 16579]